MTFRDNLSLLARSTVALTQWRRSFSSPGIRSNQNPAKQFNQQLNEQEIKQKTTNYHFVLMQYD